MSSGIFGLHRHGMSLGRLLLARLDGKMVADRAPGHGAKNGVVMGIVTGDRADDGTLDATSLSGRSSGGGEDQNGGKSGGGTGHGRLRSGVTP